MEFGHKIVKHYVIHAHQLIVHVMLRTMKWDCKPQNVCCVLAARVNGC